jgi:hypothetical protein
VLDVKMIIMVTGSILALTLAVLLLQVAALKFAPSNGPAHPTWAHEDRRGPATVLEADEH